MKPTSQQFANAAMAAVTRVPFITYKQEDCQAFVEQSIRRAGGVAIDYAGSNDMYRNACIQTMPLNDAIIEHVLEPGCLLFIVEHDGEEPEKYRQDGKGNASHVGIFTGGIYEVVHSSATKGGVAASTLKNGWTHVGWDKNIKYSKISPDGTIEQESLWDSNTEEAVLDTTPITTPAYIDLPADENVFHRISPKAGSKWWGRIPGKAQVELVSVSDGWARVRYGGHDGYVKDEFVVKDGTAPLVDALPPTSPDTPTDNTYLIPYLESLESAFTALKRALGV